MITPWELKSRSRYRRWGRVYFFVGALLLAALYGAGLAIPRATLGEWDVAIFEAFNSMLGRNPVLDWSAIIAASRVYWVSLIVAMPLFALVEGWRLRSQHYGSAFALLPVLAIVLLVLYGFVEDFNEEFHIRSPYLRPGVVDVAAIRDSDLLTVRSRAHVPDSRMLFGTFVFCVLTIHFRRSAIALMALGLPIALSNLAVGQQWFSIQLASAMTGVAVAGAFLHLSHPAMGWLERKSEAAFTAIFWRRILQQLRHDTSTGARRAVQRDDRYRAARDRSADRAAAHGYWDRVIEREIVPIVAPGGGGFELRSTMPLPGGGETSPSAYVRFLLLQDGRVFVIKRLAEYLRLFKASRRMLAYRNATAAAHLLETLGVATARVFIHNETFERGGLMRRMVVLEEYIAGEPVRLEDHASIDGAMRMLARVHSQRSARSGPVADASGPRRGEYVIRVARPRILFLLDQVGAHVPAEGRVTAFAGFPKWLEEHLLQHFAADETPFRLIHGDVHRRNFLRTPDGRLVVIDLNTAAYDFATPEVIAACVGLSGGEAGRAAALWSSYFDAAGGDAWASARAELRFGLLLHGLRLIEQRKRFRAVFGEGVVPAAVVAEWLWALTRDTDALFGETPESTDWPGLLRMLAPRRSQEGEGAGNG